MRRKIRRKRKDEEGRDGDEPKIEQVDEEEQEQITKKVEEDQPLCMRKLEDVTNKEYAPFYKSMSAD